MPRLKSKLVPKLWGDELWLVNNELYCGKILTINPGFQSSLHYHPIKDETFAVVQGEVLLETLHFGQTLPGFSKLAPGQSYRIPPGLTHRFQAVGPSPAIVVEFSTTHSDDDVVRIEESKAV